MIHKELIWQIETSVKQKFDGEGTGHDWYHIDRVRNVALAIAQEEEARLDIVEVAALVHDIGDSKLSNDTRTQREQIAEFLGPFSLEPEDSEWVISSAESVSFSKGIPPTSLEGKIVQDADRLDAIGAIAIARVFTFGGDRHRPLYDPKLGDPRDMSVSESYDAGAHSSLHHFFGKLLQLKALLHTEAAKKKAEERHTYLENYLKQFFKEWEGK